MTISTTRQPTHPELRDFGEPYAYTYGDKFDPITLRTPASIREAIAGDIRASVAVGMLPPAHYSVRSEWSGNSKRVTVYVPDHLLADTHDKLKSIADAYNYDRSWFETDYHDQGFYFVACEASRLLIPGGTGAAFRQARKSAGMTLQALSDMSGCSVSALSMYEKNARQPSVKAIRAIAQALGVTTASLVDATPSDGQSR